jgi:hypothetical protein
MRIRPAALFLLLRGHGVFCCITKAPRRIPLSCAICEKRKAERFCRAKGEKICAVHCGAEREVHIDCPSDCSYLISVHRYEDGRQRSMHAQVAMQGGYVWIVGSARRDTFSHP